MQSYRTLLSIFITVFILLGYQFIGATWNAPSAVPPGNNAPAPLNVSTTTQLKTGNLSANIFAALTEVRSDRYCDALGVNCFNPTSVESAGAISITYGGSFTEAGVCTCSGGLWCGNNSIRSCGFSSVSCTNPNPVTGSCSCPAGFVSQTTTGISTVACSKSGDSDTTCGLSAPLRMTNCYRI